MKPDALLCRLNLAWEPAQEVDTPEGRRSMQHAPANEMFWQTWRKSKSKCKDVGLTVLRNEIGEWIVYLTTTPTVAASSTVSDARQGVAMPDATLGTKADTTVASADSIAKQASTSPYEVNTGPLPASPTITPLISLLEMIRTFLLRFVVFSKPEQSVAITLWIAHTWVLDAFDYTPYLYIQSATKRCGKTRLLESLGAMAKDAWLTITPSGPTLFRKIEAEMPTILVDEFDTLYGSSRGRGHEGLRAILNAGFARGGKVPRCGSGRELIEYSVFCAKVFAGIGERLPDTVRDRSIRIELRRRSKAQKVERFASREVKEWATPVFDELALWSSRQDIIDELRVARPEIPEELGDRAADISEPLLAVADMAGGEWPHAARASLVVLLRTNDDESDDPGERLLAAIRDIFVAEGKKQIPTLQILRRLAEREEDEPWTNEWARALRGENTRGPATKMAGLLRPFGVSGGTIRLSDGSTPKGYKIEAFAEAFSLYLPDLPEKDATTPQRHNPTINAQENQTVALWRLRTACPADCQHHPLPKTNESPI